MMLDLLKCISRILGVNPIRLYYYFKGIPVFIRNIFSYKKRHVKDERFPVRLINLFPRYGDRFQKAGCAKGHYFHQDMWAAKKIFLHEPEKHTDIGSRIDGFVAHLLVFRPVTILDIRPVDSSVDGLNIERGDITALDYADNSIESLSCLHAIEHIGLGRYGDEVDVDGWSKGDKRAAESS